MPSCWADAETGRVEYIFDVALTSHGLIVRDRALPHRAEERARLPIAIDFGRELAPATFLSQAYPLYQWSVEHECRFFVRAFDLTAPSEKATYKHHLRILGQRFYLYEVLDEPW